MIEIEVARCKDFGERPDCLETPDPRMTMRFAVCLLRATRLLTDGGNSYSSLADWPIRRQLKFRFRQCPELRIEMVFKY